jgi:hypothetical protein
MNCLEVRRILGAMPSTGQAPVAEHLLTCDACLACAQRMRRLDELIRRALTVPVPEGPRVRPATTARRPWRDRWTGWQAAAGAAIAALVLWTALPRETLASSVVGHLSHPMELAPSVSDAALAVALGPSKLRLDPAGHHVIYANSCLLRGHRVAHLQLDSGHGAITIIVMPQEPIAAPTVIDASGFHGRIVPARHGSVAILGRSEFRAGELEELAAWIGGAIHEAQLSKA